MLRIKIMKNKNGQISEAKNRKFLQTAICPRNKNGQISEAVTWVVATIIIIVTLIVFIFISTKIDKVVSPSKIVSKVGNFFVSSDAGEISRLETKTKFALSINSNNEEKIKEWIENEK
jgi:hypothetical protein